MKTLKCHKCGKIQEFENRIMPEGWMGTYFPKTGKHIFRCENCKDKFIKNQKP